MANVTFGKYDDRGGIFGTALDVLIDRFTVREIFRDEQRDLTEVGLSQSGTFMIITPEVRAQLLALWAKGPAETRPEPTPKGFTKIWTKLTKQQRAELKRQRDEGPQCTFGSDRARVQNNLVSMRLSQFLDVDGEPTSPSLCPHRCVITDAGRRALEEK